MQVSGTSEQRILVVDDDKAIRDLLCAVLQRRSHRVDVASNGEEGLARLRQTRYGLVLLDLMMPRLDGHAFLDLLRELDLDPAPIVLVISASDESDLRKLDRGTVSAIIRKPFDIFELADLVTACIGSPQNRTSTQSAGDASSLARLPIADEPGHMRTEPASAITSDDPLVVPLRPPEKPEK